MNSIFQVNACALIFWNFIMLLITSQSVNQCSLTLTVPVTAIDALRHFETG